MKQMPGKKVRNAIFPIPTHNQGLMESFLLKTREVIKFQFVTRCEVYMRYAGVENVQGLTMRLEQAFDHEELNPSNFKTVLGSDLAVGIFLLAMGIGKVCVKCFEVYLDTDNNHKIVCNEKETRLKNPAQSHTVLGINVLGNGFV